jgi:predicted ATPase
MPFYGRERETASITAALARKESLVLTGKFGIGKTTLVRHIAGINADKWQFLFSDFAGTAARACRDLLAELMPPKKTAGKTEYVRYKRSRAMIVEQTKKSKRKCVIVLDNIGKLTPQRMDLIRYLAFDKQSLFIAIPERFLPEDDLFRLRASLYPSKIIRLRYLNADRTAEFFRHYARKHQLSWTESDIRLLTLTTQGYPLAMQEFITREIERRR